MGPFGHNVLTKRLSVVHLYCTLNIENRQSPFPGPEIQRRRKNDMETIGFIFGIAGLALASSLMPRLKRLESEVSKLRELAEKGT